MSLFPNLYILQLEAQMKENQQSRAQMRKQQRLVSALLRGHRAMESVSSSKSAVLPSLYGVNFGASAARAWWLELKRRACTLTLVTGQPSSWCSAELKRAAVRRCSSGQSSPAKSTSTMNCAGRKSSASPQRTAK